MAIFSIDGVIKTIEEDLFKSFELIKVILALKNMDQLVLIRTKCDEFQDYYLKL